MQPRTVLIGLDGATFSVLDPLMQDGVMPFLKGFVASGVRAPLCSVVPALTPPAWASVMTGRSPGRHGIFDFFRRDSVKSHHLRFLTSRDIECETLWSVVNRAGLRATVLNFPLTFPPPPIEGHVVPGGWMPWRQLRLGCHPEGLYDRLRALPGFNPRELAMDMAHERKALEGCTPDEYTEWVELHIRREQQWAAVVRHLAQEEPSVLTAVLFDGVDKIQHLCWRFLDPQGLGATAVDWELGVRARCLDYFRRLDALLAEIVDQAGLGATVVLASDHGFGPQVRTFFANAWLARQGYLVWTDHQRPTASDHETLGMGHLARHVYLLDWTRTRAYASMPSSNGIHIVRASPACPGGVADGEYELFRARLIEELLALRDAQTGDRVVAKIWTREEVFAGPHLELAPDLTLELEDGGLLSILDSEAAVRPRPLPVGAHRRHGIFVASGPGIRRGVDLPPLSILDVAPFVLYSLGVPIPSDFDGELPREALEPASLQARAVHTAGPVEPALEEPAPLEPVLDAEAEAEMLRRLRALGYVE